MNKIDHTKTTSDYCANLDCLADGSSLMDRCLFDGFRFSASPHPNRNSKDEKLFFYLSITDSAIGALGPAMLGPEMENSMSVRTMLV